MNDEYREFEPKHIESSTSQDIGDLALALSKAQGAMEAAPKDAANPFFKSSYATLASVMDSCRQPLSVNELSYTQLPGNAGDMVTVETILMHSSGQWIRSKVGVVPLKPDAQTLGSILSYLRRYSLSGLVGVSQADDDANKASGKEPVSKPISNDKALSLQALITDHDLDLPRIKKWMKTSLKVDEFAQLNDAGYAEVLRMVNKKIEASK